jgi:hypothetical protein
MTALSQVLIGLLTIFIGFILGSTWQLSRRTLLYWRARRFWRPFVSRDLKIVVGRFIREFSAFEASGVVGVGDMQAAAEVVSFFDDIGLRRLGSAIDIVYHDQLTGDLYDGNLVCIGGPDSNRVSDLILKKIGHTIDVGDGQGSVISQSAVAPEHQPGPAQTSLRRGLPALRRLAKRRIFFEPGSLVAVPPSAYVTTGSPDRAWRSRPGSPPGRERRPPGPPPRLKDTKTGETYSPSREIDEEGREIVTVDYGLLVQAPNPWEPRHKVMIVAGGYGYGTWAGVKLARSPQFLRSQLALRGKAVECLYKTDVIEEIPQRPEIIIVRPISPKADKGQLGSRPAPVGQGDPGGPADPAGAVES